MRIELYLNSDKGSVSGALSQNRTFHRASAIFTPVKEPRVKMAFVDFSEKEMEMKSRVEHIAEQFQMELIVYDIAKSRYALRAFLKGIRETPTILIGKEKLVGVVTEAQLAKTLKEEIKAMPVIIP